MLTKPLDTSPRLPGKQDLKNHPVQAGLFFSPAHSRFLNTPFPTRHIRGISLVLLKAPLSSQLCRHTHRGYPRTPSYRLRRPCPGAGGELWSHLQGDLTPRLRPPPEGAEQGDRESSTGILQNLAFKREGRRADGWWRGVGMTEHQVVLYTSLKLGLFRRLL